MSTSLPLAQRRRYLTWFLGLGFLAVVVVSAIFASRFESFDDASQRGSALLFAVAFGTGVITSLTPCVYPMIPIVMGVFGAKEAGRRRAFLLATSYVLGMGILFSLLGTVFALLGKQANTLLGDVRVVVPLVILYCVLALSMFGMFELQLPNSVQQKLNNVGGKGFLGAFLMGTVGALTAAPCTGPFLVGFLLYVGKTQDAVLGASVLFTFALGMGILFWILALTAISLPKSGRWMEWIKSIGGIGLIAVGINMLGPVWPLLQKFGSTQALFAIACAVAVVVGLALGAVHLSFHDSALRKLRKGLGVVLVLAGITGFNNWRTAVGRHLPWQHEEALAFTTAAASGRGVMVDFSATWCGPCKELEKTFSAPGIYEGITASFVPLKLDVTVENPENEALIQKYKAGLPTVIFLAADGTELVRIAKTMEPAEFAGHLETATQKLGSPAGS